MFVSATIPSDEPIRDLSVVDYKGDGLVVCADWTGHVWTWSMSTGEWMARPLPFAHAADPEMEPYPDAENEIDRVAALSVDGRLMLAAGGDEQEPAAWDMDSGELLWRTPVTGDYTADVIAVDGGFVTAQQYSDEVRRWSLDGDDSLLGEVPDVRCLAGARGAEHSLILAGGTGVTAWNAATESELDWFEMDKERMRTVTACALGDRTAGYGVTHNGELIGWEPGDEWGGEDLFEPIAVSDQSVEAIAVVPIAGRMLVVTGDRQALRWWDASDGTGVGHTDIGRHDITAMESAIVDGRPVLVTSGRDGTLRLWDESDPRS